MAIEKDISPNSKAWAYKVLGEVLMRENNNFEEARICFKNALKLNAKVGAKKLLQKCEEELNNKKYQAKK